MGHRSPVLAIVACPPWDGEVERRRDDARVTARGVRRASMAR